MLPFKLNEVQEVSFTDGKAIHPHPTITLGVSLDMGEDQDKKVLVESDKFKITTKSREIYLFHFRSDTSFLPWKRILNEKLGSNYQEIFVKKEKVSKSVAIKFKTMKRNSELFFN